MSAVHAFNQRDVAGILAMIRTLGALVGASGKADALAAELEQRLAKFREETAPLPRRPRVYFEEWDDPMISGIRWVSELIEEGAAAWPLSARVQQRTMPVVGNLEGGSPEPSRVVAFHKGLRKPAMSRPATWRSNIAGPTITPTDISGASEVGSLCRPMVVSRIAFRRLF